MSDTQTTQTANREESATLGEFDAALFVGKIPQEQGLWGALEQVATCDSVRNGVLVVFSEDKQGRLGVFCNRYITGAVVDSTGEVGSNGITELLAVKDGMFCFRPCLADEAKELGQNISLNVHELIAAHEASESSKSSADVLGEITATQIQAGLSDNFLDDVAEAPVESMVVFSSRSAGSDSLTGGFEESLTESLTEPAEEPASSKGSMLGSASLVPKESASAVESVTEGPNDYLDWLDDNNKANSKPNASNLRKILAPALPSKNDGAADGEKRASSDVEMFKRVLQQEEQKVREQIEKTMENMSDDAGAKQKLDDMKLLQGMLQQQEKMINQRWQGLDEIRTPNISGAGTHATRADAGRAAALGGASNATDLVNTQTIATDPKQFLRGKASDEQVISATSWDISTLWHTHPRYVAGGIAGIFLLIMILMSVQLDSSEAQRLLKVGAEHIKHERWDDAIPTLSAVIQKDSGNGRAYFYRAIAKEETLDDKGAQEDFKAARDHGVSANDVALAQAGVALRNQDWQKAHELSDQAIISGTKTAALYRLHANANIHLGSFEQAIADCDHAMALLKDDAHQRAQILGDRGFAKIELRQFEEGAQDFDDALKAEPTSGLYILKGDAYRKVKKFADAAKAYSLAIDLDPSNYDAYVARGICEASQHKNTEALRDFGKAIQLKPNGVEAMIQRGSLHLAVGDYRLAIDDLQNAWDLNPTVAETQQKLLAAYAQAKRDVPKSVSDVELPAVSVSPKVHYPSDPRQLVLIGYNALNQNNFDQAVEALTLAVQKAPRDADARRYLAHAFARSGNLEAAASQFHALSSLAALSLEDTNCYCDAAEKSGHTKEAAAAILAYLAANEENTQLRMRLARMYYKNNQTKDGDEAIRTGMAKTSSPEDRKQLEDLYKNKASQQGKDQNGAGGLPKSGSHG